MIDATLFNYNYNYDDEFSLKLFSISMFPLHFTDENKILKCIIVKNYL